MKNPCIDVNACCEHDREGECKGGYERYLACLQSYVGCAECPAKDKRIAALQAALAERESLAYGGLLAKLHAIEDAAGGRDVDVVDVLHSYAQALAAESERREIAEADAEGYVIQHKDFLDRARLAEAKLALVRERWSAWQKVRVLGICIGERMRLPGAAPDAIIDALDEACQG